MRNLYERVLGDWCLRGLIGSDITPNKVIQTRSSASTRNPLSDFILPNLVGLGAGGIVGEFFCECETITSVVQTIPSPRIRSLLELLPSQLNEVLPEGMFDLGILISSSCSMTLRLPVRWPWECNCSPRDLDIDRSLYCLLPWYSRVVFDREPYVPRTRLKTGFRVGRLPAIMPVLHSVLNFVSIR
jgi:hypothetical protein